MYTLKSSTFQLSLKNVMPSN